MIDRTDSELPPVLRRAVRQWGDAPAPTPIWRQQLFDRISTSARGDGAPLEQQRPPRHRTVRLSAAIAAGFACLLAGGVATYAAMRARSDSTAVATTAQPASSALPRVRFELVAPSARRVSIVGDFTGWSPNALPMRRSPDGRTWEIEVPLAPGRYAYSFVVDGALSPDPAAPRAGDEDFGSPSSIVLVKGAGS
jgi:hypothetical protein